MPPVMQATLCHALPRIGLIFNGEELLADSYGVLLVSRIAVGLSIKCGFITG